MRDKNLKILVVGISLIFQMLLTSLPSRASVALHSEGTEPNTKKLEVIWPKGAERNALDILSEAQSIGRATATDPGTTELLAVTIGFVSKAELLQTQIWVDKREYLLAEPILVKYRVKNIGDKVVMVNLQETGRYLDMKDEQGESYPKKRSYSTPVSLSYSLYFPDSLTPGDEVEGCINLQDIYGAISAGEYTCLLRNPEGRVTNALMLPNATSNTIGIWVKNPTGEEKKALDVFSEAKRLGPVADIEDTSGLKGAELSFAKYQELVKTFPNSVYAPMSLKAAIGLYLDSQDLNQRRRIIPLCIKLIEDYPDCHLFAEAFADIAHTYEMLKDRERAIKTMQELIEKHPNTKISEEAERRLKQIKGWDFE